MEEYTPNFRTEVEDERFLWICDAEQRVAIFDSHELNFELLHGARPDRPLAYSMPRYYHTPTLRGARITGLWWLDSQFAPSSQEKTLTLLDDEPRQWGFRMVEKYRGDDEGEGWHEYRLGINDDGYVIDCRAGLCLRRTCRAEFANFLAYGVGEAWPHRKRFTHTLWSHPDGRILSVPHNPLHPIVPGLRRGDQRHVGNFIGFFAASQPAWIVEILESSSGVKSHTCDNAYDEHLEDVWADPDEDGFHNLEVHYRLRQLGHAAARELIVRAQLIDPFPEGNNGRVNWRLPGFAPGQAGTAARTPEVKLGEVFIGACWPVSGGAWHSDGVYADYEVCFNGGPALRLHNQNSGDTQSVRPEGTSIHLESDRRYRLSARAKTNCPAGSRAYISARQVYYNPSAIEFEAITEILSGMSDWMHLSLDIVPIEDDPYLVIDLHLDGSGDAWFDCLELAIVEPTDEVCHRH